MRKNLFPRTESIKSMADLCFRYDNEVQNGGHLQFFNNTTIENFDKYDLVIEALKFFKATAQAKILTKAVAVRKKANRRQNQNVYEYISCANEGKYDHLDTKYYNCKPNIIQLIEDFIDNDEKADLAHEDLVTQYVEQSKFTNLSRCDYSDSMKVARSNRAATQMRKIAISIEKKYPEMKNRFMMLLSNPNLQCVVAHHMLEVMNYDMGDQKKALNVIEKNAQGDDISALGNRMWLKDWYERNPPII